MIQHASKRWRCRQHAFDLTGKILDRHPAVSKETGFRNQTVRQTLQGEKLATKVKSGNGSIVVVPQDLALPLPFNSATRAAKPGVGLRRDKAIPGKIARKDRLARHLFIAV